MLWPLSSQEAFNITRKIQKADGGAYWLRSPGGLDDYAAAVDGYGVLHAYGFNGASWFGVRPAFNLNLSSILFTSDYGNGKFRGDVNGVLKAVKNTTENSWRVTLKDDSRSGFSAARVGSGSVVAGGKLTIKFSGAGTGDDEYVSAVLVKAGAENDILYYGHIASNAAASGDTGVNVTIPVDLDNGNYILKVFSEKINPI